MSREKFESEEAQVFKQKVLKAKVFNFGQIGRAEIFKLSFLTNLLIVAFCLAANSAAAQVGGRFQIESAAIAAGGETSAGGRFSLPATAGQTFAGDVSYGGVYTLAGGFWQSNLAPTAAAVALGGRVLTADGGGIQNASVMITFPDGQTRQTTTGTFGNYRFGDVPAGEIYVLNVFSNRFVFANPTLVVTAAQDLNDLNFTAER